MSDEVALACLTLFHAMLLTRSELVFTNLIFSYEVPQAILERPSNTDAIAGSDLRNRLRTLLLPPSLCSASPVARGPYITAALQAHVRWAKTQRLWKRYGRCLTVEATCLASHIQVSSPSHPLSSQAPLVVGAPESITITRSPFLSLVMRRVRRLPEQAVRINVAVLAIVTTLLQVPNDALHYALLDHQALSLVTVLQAVVLELTAKASRIDDIATKLSTARLTLNGSADARLDQSAAPATKGQDVVHALVVCEEFLIELTATALVWPNATLSLE